MLHRPPSPLAMADRGAPPSGSDYADAMRGVLERAAEVDGAHGITASTKGPLLSRPPVVASVFIVFVGVMVFNLQSSRRKIPPIPPQAEAAAAQISVMIGTQVVEAYREEHGELPASLEDVGLEDEAYVYSRSSDGHFELGAAVGSTRVRYDSREGPVSLLRAMGLPIEGNR